VLLSSAKGAREAARRPTIQDQLRKEDARFSRKLNGILMTFTQWPQSEA
jgi:hypothetical protein